jgi:hypothetical protein
VSRARSRSVREYTPRNRTPRTSPRPKIVAQTCAHVLDSTDPRGTGAAKLQRLSDGTTRILLLGQMGTPATHGYQVALHSVTAAVAALRTVQEPAETYIVSLSDWAAVAQGGAL